MNIFIIARGYPSKNDPTWGCFEKDQAIALANLGHRITILSVDTRFRRYWRPLGIQHIEEENISIYNIFIIPYALLFFLPAFIKDYFFSKLLEIVYLKAIAKQGKPDILYSHYLHNTHKALRIKRKFDIPLVSIEHSSELGYTNISKSIVDLANKTYPNVDQLITVSSFLKENILKYIPLDNILIVPNVVGPDFTYKLTAKNEKTFKIISIGSYIHRKGFDILIEALALAHPMLQGDWEAIIIGGGELESTLKQQIHSHHLQQHIQLLGKKDKKEIIQTLQNSDIFVLASRSETFGVVYIEALACGLPIIATDCGGPRDIVTTENGILIPSDDVNALSKAIVNMQKNIYSYNSETIALGCRNHFAPEIIAKRLISIFEETIKKHKEH